MNNDKDVSPKRCSRSDSSMSSLESVVERLRACKKVLIVSGAGISVSCGIPDFRSKEGLYNTLDCARFGIPSAELIFDHEFFKIDPDPFFRFSSVLLPNKNLKPSPSHHFIHGLDVRKKLLKVYTQNIDGIERRMGINPKRLIECHGTFASFHCTNEKCKRKTKLEGVKKHIEEGSVPYCSKCKGQGVMKPDITFFGENLPNLFMDSLNNTLLDADMVIVMGTSLKVGGSVHEVLRMVGMSTHKVPFLLINREPVALPACVSKGFDVSLLGLCDDICAYLAMRCFSPVPSSSKTKVGLKVATEDEMEGDTVDVTIRAGAGTTEWTSGTTTTSSKDFDDDYFAGLIEEDFAVSDLGSPSHLGHHAGSPDVNDLASRAHAVSNKSYTIKQLGVEPPVTILSMQPPPPMSPLPATYESSNSNRSRRRLARGARN
jgi:NAD-dependent SIR2 family protein deacetylase